MRSAARSHSAVPRHRAGRLWKPLGTAAACGTIALVGACRDSSRGPTAPETLRETADPVRQGAAASSTPLEQTALNTIARGFAIALNDPALRTRVLEDLRASRVTREHKIELRTYLRGERGAKLLAKLGEVTGFTRANVLATAEAVRALELYFPVPEHRDAWTGGTDIQVGAQIADADVPVAFRIDGTRVQLSTATIPSTPTLMLVPVETDFAQQLPAPAAPYKASYKASSRSSSAGPRLMVACDENNPCGGGGPAYQFNDVGPGLYMTNMDLVDTGEPWTKGDPEIEVHLQGPNTMTDPTAGQDLSCAGQHASDSRKQFNQTGNSWSGSVMLYTQAEVDAFNAREASMGVDRGYNIMVWEDDDGPCVLKFDKDNIKSALTTTQNAYGVVSSKAKDGALGKVIKALNFVALIYNAASWLKSNDDWNGVAVDRSATTDAVYNGATHVLKRGTGSNGNITLLYH